MENPQVWLIDENKQQIDTFANVLRSQLPRDISVGIVYPPLGKPQDYLGLLNSPETACIIIDQRLKDTGIANYYGIELAQFLRSVNKKIPIYILTNFSDDVEAFREGEWSVEDIISKSDLAKLGSDKSKTVFARIIRRLSNYSDYLAQRERRFNELLKKTLYGHITEEDKQELDDIQFERTATILAEELPRLQELSKILEEYKKFTSNL